MLILGKNTKSITALELLLTTDLAWSVEKQELFAKGSEGQSLKTNHVALIRTDTNAILGVHKIGYEVCQNQRMAEQVLALSQYSGAPVHSAGFLREGRKVYIQLKTENLNLGNDRIEGYLTAVNSFDGSTLLGFGNSTVTISCQNTFFAAYKTIASKFKHTANMEIKLEDMLHSLDIFNKDEIKHFAIIKKLAAAPVTAETIELVYKTMFNVKMADVLNKDVISTRKANQLAKFNQYQKIEIEQKGANLWGLFSGVTSYTTKEANEETKMFGKVAKDERILFDQLAKIVK